MTDPSADLIHSIHDSEHSENIVAMFSCQEQVGDALDYAVYQPHGLWTDLNHHEDGWVTWDWTCSLKMWADICRRYQFQPLMRRIDRHIYETWPKAWARLGMV